MKEKKQKQARVNASSLVDQAVNVLKNEGRGNILSDILGSYTGTAQDGEVPEQDPDDL